MFVRIKLWRERHTIMAPFVALLLASVLAGTAFAAWSYVFSPQANNFSGQVGTMNTTQVVVAASPSCAAASFTGLQAMPGGNGAICVKLTNNATSTLYVDSWDYSATPTSLATDAACPAANFSFPAADVGTQQVLTTHVALPAGASTDVPLPNAYTLSAAAPNGCQATSLGFTGVTPLVNLTIGTS